MLSAGIILAGGLSNRYGKKKELENLCGKNVINFSIEAFQKANIPYVVVLDKIFRTTLPYKSTKLFLGFANPGEKRFDSIMNAINKLSEAYKNIVIHDGARPIIYEEDIKQGITLLKNYDGVIIGYPAVDAIKIVKGNTVIKNLSRENVFMVQTPEFIKRDVLMEAIKKINTPYLDDTVSILIKTGYKVKLLRGKRDNIKLTYPEDIYLLKGILKC